MNILVLSLAALLDGTAATQAQPATSAALPAFDHLAINVADQQRSIDFYRGAFGL